MKKIIGAMAIAAAVVVGATESRADGRAWEWSPLGIGIAAPVQLPYMSSSVYGIRAGWIFGYNEDVYGVDAGLVEATAGSLMGVQWSGFSWTDGDAYGIQGGCFANIVNGEALALQVAFANINYGDKSGGCAIGAVNYALSHYGLEIGLLDWSTSASAGMQIAVGNVVLEDYTGFSVGAVNMTTKLTGCQIGAFNFADETTGCQIGVINATDRMHGVQIGFINLICQSKLPVMVVANATF